MLEPIEDQILIIWCRRVVIALVFLIPWLIIDAQEFIEPACDLPFNVDYSIDYTELMLEGHRETDYSKTIQSERWFEIRDEWIEIYGGGRIVLGTYNVLGQWAVVWLLLREEGRIYVEMGRNWAIGEDKQLHSPYCSEILPANAFRFFVKFPECEYPVWCE